MITLGTESILCLIRLHDKMLRYAQHDRRR